jgi:glycosyltransferase involved in cell wall biosynthesis
VDVVTTWNERCGIAAYSDYLIAELKKSTQIRIVTVPHVSAFSPYFLVLGFKTGRTSSLIHVQFAYGMFPDLNLAKKRSLPLSAFLFYLGLALSANGDNRVITTIHDPLKTVNPKKQLAYVYVKSQAFLFRLTSDLVIALNEESRILLNRNYEVPKFRTKVIPIGCLEHPQFLEQDECKKKLKLTGKSVLTLPGFVIRSKGYDLVVEILPLLGENVRLLIAGGTRSEEDSLYREELKELAQRNNSADKIVFDDSFPITSTIMNATDIALLPYKEADDSMMVRDLVSYRVPTITSDIPVFKNIKNEYDCIELFKAGDRNDLLEKINSLRADEKKRDLLKNNCEKMWNATKWSSIAAKHLETYLEVMAAVPEEVYQEKRQRERMNWLKKNLSGGSLEIGCATGYVTNYVGADVGLDLNQYRVRVAKQKYREKDFIVASARLLPFKENAFSTVLIPEILEHVSLSHASEILAESKRVSREILITLPNAEKNNYDKNIVENPEHKWFPTKEIVQKLVKECVIEYSEEKDFILVLCGRKLTHA